MSYRFASTLSLVLAVAVYPACSGSSSRHGGPDEGGSGGTAGTGGSTSAGAAGVGAASGQGGSSQSGGAGQSAGDAGASGAPEAGAANASGGNAGGDAGGGAGSGGSGTDGGTGNSGGNASLGGEGGAGNAAGSGGSGGDDAGPNCTEGNLPLVWLLLSRSSGMFEETVIGNLEAFNVIRAALTGADGVLRDLDGRARVGLTLFGGVRPDACPTYSSVTPDSDTFEVESTVTAVAAPVVKEESPLPAAYAATLELVRARDEVDKTIVIIANSVPDFCDDSSTWCPRDAVIGGVQEAYADGIRTLLVGVRHPIDTVAAERESYFQAVANAGRGYPAAPFVDTVMLDAACDEVQGTYDTPATLASWISGSADASAEAFSSEFKAQLGALGCPR